MSARAPMGIAARAARPRRLRVIRERMRGLSRTTPFLLSGLSGAVTVVALLLLGAASLGIADRARAFQAVGRETAPSINTALDLYFDLSDMDADAASYLLLGRQATGDVNPLSVLNQYERRRQEVSHLLVSAARDAGSTEERTSVDRMQLMTQTFNFSVGQAVALSDQGRAADALAEYERATDLMHAPFNGLLETALDLAAAQQARLAAANDEAIAQQGRDLWLLVSSAVVLLVLLGTLQLTLALRTRRYLNLWALGASALTLILLVGAGLTLHASDQDLAVARQAFDSEYALRQARAIAYDARADEARSLIDPTRSDTYGQSFLDKSLELASFPPSAPAPAGPTRSQGGGSGLPSYLMALADYESELARPLAALQSGQKTGLDGELGRALSADAVPGDRSIAIATLVAYDRFEDDDRVLRADVGHGDVSGAIGLATSQAQNSSSADFDVFSADLTRWIDLRQQQFDGATAAGGGSLDGWRVAVLVMAPLVFVLTWVGVWPRLREYAWGRR